MTEATSSDERNPLAPSQSNMAAIVVGAAVGAAVLLCLICVFVVFLVMRKRNSDVSVTTTMSPMKIDEIHSARAESESSRSVADPETAQTEAEYGDRREFNFRIFTKQIYFLIIIVLLFYNCRAETAQLITM